MTWNTQLKRGLTAVFAVSLIAYMILQQDKIRVQAEKLMHSSTRISFLETSLESSLEENTILHQENEELAAEMAVLKDSIQGLNTRIGLLQNELSKSKKTLGNIYKELAEKQTEIAQLKDQLTMLQNDKKSAQQAISALEEDLNSKMLNIEQLNSLRAEESKVQEETEQVLMAQELERKRLEQVQSITQFTKVTYREIACKSRRSSKKLKKMDNDGSNWVFTTLVFDLVNPEQHKINEEYFRVKIVDIDTGEELPFNESNPAFAEKGGETFGFTFQWRENPTEAVYINMQAKKGKNYDARIYFINNEQEHFLVNSAMPLVRDGKMIKY